ncbi:MAG: hypothetical protein JW867_05325 [Candidatus Omnitrophica bacterium]|nr:hypothetical protein [Candidatus Omnitrophota bacterium]
MKTRYEFGEDIFLAMAIFLTSGSVIMKIFEASFNLGFAEVTSVHFARLGVISLLFNIALNLQDLARK